jgi:hypothetical protein
MNVNLYNNCNISQCKAPTTPTPLPATPRTMLNILPLLYICCGSAINIEWWGKGGDFAMMVEKSVKN